MDFKNKFNELLSLEKISQIKLAEQLNVSRQAITNLKNGNSLPSLDLLCAISEYFDISTDYLLGLKDESGRKILSNKSSNIK